jgi:hypothetical protein
LAKAGLYLRLFQLKTKTVSEEIRMRKLLLPALLALGVGLTGGASASALIGSGLVNKAATNFSPLVQQVTHQCRIATKCDKNGKNCHDVDVCRY